MVYTTEMTSPFSASQQLFRVTLFAVLMQLVVPVGLMPQATSEGWWLKVCPDGIPASVMMEVFGHDHHHHHGHDTETYEQCDLGGVLFDHPAPVSIGVASIEGQEIFFTPQVQYLRLGGFAHYQSRAPPVRHLT